MKEKAIIQLNNVGMMFNFNSERIDSVKEYFIRLCKGQVFFRKFWALRYVSLQIQRGEIVGIIGVNGSGKSTLLKIIAGVFKPSEGSIQKYGSIAPLIELGVGFDGNLSARENVYLNGAILGHSKSDMKKRYKEIIEFAELEKFQDLPIKNFSSGMIARLGFAIAVSHTPDILIIDEILAVGDFNFQQKCHRRINDMISKNATVLIVSHNADELKELCSRIIWLKDGRIYKDGDTKAVLESYLGDGRNC